MRTKHLFLHGDIVAGSLIEEIGQSVLVEPAPLVIWINSHGGDLMETIAAGNLLRASKLPTTAIINGVAASSALVLSTFCSRTLAVVGSFGMMHSFSSEMAGTSHDFRDEMVHQELLKETMFNALTARGRMPEEVATHLLGRADRWLSDVELVEFGFVDKLVENSTILEEV